MPQPLPPQQPQHAQASQGQPEVVIQEGLAWGLEEAIWWGVEGAMESAGALAEGAGAALGSVGDSLDSVGDVFGGLSL